MYQIEFLLPRSTSTQSLDVLADIFENLSFFETPDNLNWSIKIVYEECPPVDIKQTIVAMLSEMDLVPTHLALEELPNVDWLVENRKSFPALTIGEFYIYGSHLQPSNDPDLINIQLDASMAFGTGKHATTQGCLELIQQLPIPDEDAEIIDLGCGTALLAMAMAKLWDLPVMASDIDIDAVLLAEKNIEMNGVAHLVTSLRSDGFDHPLILSQAPYDLIVANILAEPLKSLAPQMGENTKPSATLILSGLLASQIDSVVESYVQNGFELVSTKIIEEWAALRLTKVKQ